MKTLCIAHVFYPEFWPELAACIRNVDGPLDLVVTYVDDTKGIPEMVLRDFPRARMLLCENRGFDVWPFLKALGEVDLSSYDIIVKLHTKRDVKASHALIFNHRNYLGPRWRNYLLGFIRRPEDWTATKRRFDDPRVGMVADARVILRKDDVPWRTPRFTVTRSNEFTEHLYGRPLAEEPQFVAGTMFAVRPAVFGRLLARGWSVDDFSASVRDGTEQTAHLLERVFGAVVSMEGLRIEPCHGTLAASRFRACLIGIARAIGLFLLDVHRVDGRLLVKVLRLSVYRGPRPAGTGGKESSSQ
ncbi:MAG: hypothetical protein IKO72_06500 [Kiritimatiellae bacterium]|nr:hypothetical protein [Kiritimatiellia bacterium]